MFNKKEADLTFISKIPGLTQLEDCLPKPTAKYTPDWWKSLKIDESKKSAYDLYTGNIKHCPSFTDVFSSGYVVPMWMDIYLGYDKETGQYGTQSNNLTNISYHNGASVDLKNYKFLGKETSAFFKAYSPWSIITKPDISIMILPLFFNFDPDFSVVPGIMDTDIVNHISPDIAYHSKNREIFIERGTPLFQVIPFKKQKATFDVKEIDELSDSTRKKYYHNVLDHQTRIRGNKFYSNKRKDIRG
jgi:hypothetical protein